MGNLFSRGPAGEASEVAAGTPEERQSLKGTWVKVVKKGPTEKKSKRKVRGVRDGRSYKEVVRGGPEDGTMSALSGKGAAWEFSAAPKDKEV